ncbi:MAG: hypothetical protein AB1796_07120 [Bacillota bacterium]
MRVNTTDLQNAFGKYLSLVEKECWIVDLENKSINQYSFSQERDIRSLNTFREEDTIKSTVFEGLEIPLKDIFTVN